jgi:hypothetical protein
MIRLDASITLVTTVPGFNRFARISPIYYMKATDLVIDERES